MKFKIFGTKIHISFLFLEPVTLMIFIDKSGLFLPSLLAVTIHETAHLTAMYMLRCNPKEIRLIPTSICIVRQIEYRHKNEIIISLLGPLANLLFFSAFFVVYRLCGNSEILTFALINFLFAIFNLLPIKALDGGFILYKLLSIKFGENKGQIVLNILSFVLAVMLILAGVFLFLKNKNFSVILMGIYIILSIIIKL